ncbi:branched-chain amino acid ABC transporter permease [Natrinema caseinilyticum]|uniref:branched-chain amino acid ABC transporter permease n=1 Tax=Natrinema caseinilyticum TaxID=2961570 RepID=UPI0020C4CDFD|nr:branched-chain amino acid ABC transporter permease [Natrinema caseinilyticum]
MIEQLLSILVVGAMISAVYALVAIGFTMIFGVGGVLNLAHGALIMIGAFAYLAFTSTSGALSLPPVVGFVVAVAVTAGASYVLYAGLVTFIEDDIVITFLATVVVALLVTELVIIQFGSAPSQLVPIVSGSIYLESVGTRLRYVQLIAFVVSWIAIGALWYYVSKTDEGRSILAASMSTRGAELTGVNLRKVKSRTWLIAGAFAGIAGVFIGTLQSTSPQMWLSPLALAFIIVVVGGIGSIKGSVIAAYLIGYLETASVEFLGPSFQGVLSLIVLVAILLVLPNGLYGRELVHE